jgi:hypothetical protein
MAATRLPEQLQQLQAMAPYPESLVVHEGRPYFIGRPAGRHVIGILAGRGLGLSQGFNGSNEERGAFQAGWRELVGADADHLKTPEDAGQCCAAGFTFFTIDSGAHVDAEADHLGGAALRERYEAPPWQQLESRPVDALRPRVSRPCPVEGVALNLSDEIIARTAVKYGRAIAHVTAIFRYIERIMGARPFELEVSVDETETPTTHEQHFFSIYEIAAKGTRGLLRLKTAGTSCLEALRAISIAAPDLFRGIMAFARIRCTEDRASHHVSAELRNVPEPKDLVDARLPSLPNQCDARQVLHVTFGSVLTLGDGLKERLYATLVAHEETHYAALRRHFVRHLMPLKFGASAT